jgi:hypothetical protein
MTLLDEFLVDNIQQNTVLQFAPNNNIRHIPTMPRFVHVQT